MMRRLLRDQRGSIAVKFALCAPFLAMMGAGAIDLSAVVSDRQQLFDIAEAAALAGAQNLTLAMDNRVAAERAKSWAEAHVENWKNGPKVVVTAEIVTLAGNQPGVHVTLAANRPSFFGNLLPPGGWNSKGEATAERVGKTPLCVLAHGDKLGKVINVKHQGLIRAPSCLIHSNEDIVVENSGRIEADLTQAVGTVSGGIYPAGGSGAEPIADPFEGLDLKSPPVCGLLPSMLKPLSGLLMLQPGIHCGAIHADGDAEVRLAPGEHWFVDGDFKMAGRSRLTGKDVVLLFDRKSRFQFHEEATVDLEGRKSGRFAGFVLAAMRENTGDFEISSDHVGKLLGVVYIPRAKLIVDGKRDVAKDSDWTVLIAQRVELKGSPRLVINANYGISDVPVPQGVGPNGKSAGSRLVR